MFPPLGQKPIQSGGNRLSLEESKHSCWKNSAFTVAHQIIISPPASFAQKTGLAKDWGSPDEPKLLLLFKLPSQSPFKFYYSLELKLNQPNISSGLDEAVDSFTNKANSAVTSWDRKSKATLKPFPLLHSSHDCAIDLLPGALVLSTRFNPSLFLTVWRRILFLGLKEQNPEALDWLLRIKRHHGKKKKTNKKNRYPLPHLTP